jgi:hypothetical protein
METIEKKELTKEEQIEELTSQYMTADRLYHDAVKTMLDRAYNLKCKAESFTETLATDEPDIKDVANDARAFEKAIQEYDRAKSELYDAETKVKNIEYTFKNMQVYRIQWVRQLPY